jgi:hypothetical protein
LKEVDSSRQKDRVSGKEKKATGGQAAAAGKRLKILLKSESLRTVA